MMIRWSLALLAVFAVSAGVAHAGGRSLPPHTDLDPDRGMTFGRLSRTRLDSSVLAPYKQSAKPRMMDPAIDPFISPLKSDRYDPQTGKIQGSLSDTLKEMRKRQDTARRLSDTHKKEKQRQRSLAGADDND